MPYARVTREVPLTTGEVLSVGTVVQYEGYFLTGDVMNVRPAGRREHVLVPGEALSMIADFQVGQRVRVVREVMLNPACVVDAGVEGFVRRFEGDRVQVDAGPEGIFWVSSGDVELVSPVPGTSPGTSFVTASAIAPGSTVRFTRSVRIVDADFGGIPEGDTATVLSVSEDFRSIRVRHMRMGEVVVLRDAVQAAEVEDLPVAVLDRLPVPGNLVRFTRAARFSTPPRMTVGAGELALVVGLSSDFSSVQVRYGGRELEVLRETVDLVDISEVIGSWRVLLGDVGDHEAGDIVVVLSIQGDRVTVQGLHWSEPEVVSLSRIAAVNVTGTWAQIRSTQAVTQASVLLPTHAFVRLQGPTMLGHGPTRVLVHHWVTERVQGRRDWLRITDLVTHEPLGFGVLDEPYGIFPPGERVTVLDMSETATIYSDQQGVLLRGAPFDSIIFDDNLDDSARNSAWDVQMGLDGAIQAQVLPYINFEDGLSQPARASDGELISIPIDSVDGQDRYAYLSSDYDRGSWVPLSRGRVKLLSSHPDGAYLVEDVGGRRGWVHAQHLHMDEPSVEAAPAFARLGGLEDFE